MLTYEELSADEFRLLTLKPLSYHPTTPVYDPSDNAITVHCALKASLRSPPPIYDTLSYVWGPSVPRKYICVNGVPFAVGLNLECALRYLRLPDEDLVIWIDAICINQNYSKEQAAQVRHMKDIYANSVKTIVWLGPPVVGDGIDTDLCIETMKEIGSKMIAVDAIGAIKYMTDLSNREDLDAYEKALDRVKELLEPIFLKEDTPKLRFFNSGFIFISNLPYWTRVWTQQEIAVARSVEFALGNARIPFEEFSSVVPFVSLWRRHMVNHIITQYRGNQPGDYVYWVEEFLQKHPAYNIAKCVGLRAHYQQDDEEQIFGLFHLLVRAHVTPDSEIRCACTLAVDRIFGMLGVAKDAPILDIQIDYEAPTELVYSKVARALIEAGHVDLLAYCQFHPLEIEDTVLKDGKIVRKIVDSETEIPTWVPDWRRELRRPCGEYTWDTAFRASGQHEYELILSDPSNAPNILKLKGIRIDIIETTGSPWRPKTIDTPPLSLIAPFLAEIEGFCHKSNSKQEENPNEIYKNASDRADAHYRIPVADQEMTNIGNRRRATQATEEGYAKVLADTKRDTPEDDPSSAKGSYLNMMGYLYFRRPFLSGKGFVGLGPEIVEVGDVVCVMLGARLPYILRERGDGSYRVVGEAYVHGVMYGEAWESQEGREAEVFELK